MTTTTPDDIDAYPLFWSAMSAAAPPTGPEGEIRSETGE